MTKPVENPETLLLQERFRAAARRGYELADRIAADEHIEEPAYTAGMMRLQADMLARQADALEDDDDLTKATMFVTQQELQLERLDAKLTEAQTEDAAGKHRQHWWRPDSNTGMWLAFVAALIATLALGFQLGMAVQRALFGE